jgi:hypothetical protein
MEDKMASIIEINGVEHLVDLEVAQEFERLQSLTQWVPVTERLPENNDPVLAYGKSVYHDDVPAYYAARYNKHLDEFSIPGIGGLSITHWMPLPLPPEGVK